MASVCVSARDRPADPGSRSAASERRRLNSLNYADLLHLTARVLRENVGVRRALQQKFRYLLVDEFQDTDPIQAEIVFWLAEDGASPPRRLTEPPLDWRRRCGPARCSSWATRNSRSTASAARTSISTTSSGNASASPASGACCR